MRLVAAEGGGLPSEPLTLFADIVTMLSPGALVKPCAPAMEWPLFVLSYVSFVYHLKNCFGKI